MFVLKMFVTVINVILIASMIIVLLDKRVENDKGLYAMLSALFFTNTLFIWY